MTNDMINEWLLKYDIPLHQLALNYTVAFKEVKEMAELYLLINCTTDVFYLYQHLERYGNQELQKAISDLICHTF